MRIDIYSHNFSVSDYTPREKEIIGEFIQPLIMYSMEKQRGGRYKRVPVRLYGAAFKDRTQFRFHINQLEEFKQLYLKYYNTLDYITFVTHEFDPANFPVVEHIYRKPITPFEEQVEFVDGILAPGERKMLGGRTGFGKTIVSLYCAARLGARTLLTFKGGFKDRWKDELEKRFVLERGDLIVIEGTAELIAVMEMALAGELEAKFIILTTKLYQMYLDKYEKASGEETIYPVPPHEFHETLGIGYHVKDEFHMEHHLNHRIELYTHCPKTLALSATMLPSDPFLDQMYRIAYPLHERMLSKKFDPYIIASAMFYRFHKPGVVKYNGSKGYSHVAFEQSLMAKKSSILSNYLKMCYNIVKRRFLDIMNPGETSIVFCATVDLCTEMAEYFKKLRPDINITRYTQADDYEESLMKGTLVFSTVLSAGTAVDKAGLRFVLMTTAINSRQSNEQALGREREMWKHNPAYKTDPVLKEVRPEFAYLVCHDIDKHVQYHEAKEEYFRGRVLKHQRINLPDVI